ncbi:MAG: hypothetical protein RL459_1701 [Pseudomonadota bacterium]|jgi:aldose 1-epimerase
MVYEHQSDGCWPFPFTASQDIRLEDQRINLSLSYCNTHTDHVPVGLGWHPYFEKRAGARVIFDAKGRWEIGADKLPTHRTECTGMNQDAQNIEVDNCFDGWSGIAEISDPLLTLRISSQTGFMVAYTKCELGFLALEPVSHVSNALQLSDSLGCDAAKLGMSSLAPGGTLRLDISIDVR